MTMPARPPGAFKSRAPRDMRFTALLGPTNTGKTHLAIERMLSHSSGMIGLPLRLLAREVYEKVKAQAGAAAAALITGEEKIIPADPRFWVCTVEAMPLDRDVAFLAVDEIQLCADPERGHIFTHRLLHARGTEETMLLGAETIRPLIASLLPEAQYVNRPRFSELSYAGPRKLTRLPRRSAVVAFSVTEVYAIAELIRRQRGGAAIVMGALSPRTRNAQVALYQSGEVDFLVATDAVGMGLNMDVDHVAFASLSKFDGRDHRPLNAAELAQIAGRAGRFENDGTFGTTADAPALPTELVQQIEQHQFEPLRVLQWRNSALDFSTLEALQASLEAPSPHKGLVRARQNDDLMALTAMARDDIIRRLACAPAAIKTLWEVAQVPDFRKTLPSEHVALLSEIYLSLMSEQECISAEWMAAHFAKLDNTEGDIDTLAQRLAHMRTLSFIANRAHWLSDPGEWQSRSRALEDRLSDALHEKLTQTFVDRRTSVLMRRLNEAEPLGATVNEDGEVLVEGEFVGRLQGFQFMADPRATGVHGRAVRAAAMKGLSPEMQRRADLLAECGNEAIHLTEHGRLIWQGAVIARLMPKEPLKPRIEILASDLLEGEARVKARNRLERWLTDHIEHVLSPLFKLTRAEDITGLSRGLAFRLVENFGAIARSEIAGELAALDQPARAQLRRYGVRFGAFSVFLPLLIKPAPAGLLAILRALWEFGPKGLAELPALPAAGLTSLPTDSAMPANIYAALGYYLCGERAVRRDMLERLADLIRETMKKGSPRGGFESSVEMMSLMGASPEGLAKILASLGFRAQKEKRPASQKNAKIESAIGVSTQDTPQTEPEIGVDQQNADEPDKLAACVDASVPELLPQEGEELIEIWRPARTKPAAHVLPRSLPQGENDGHFGPRKRGSGRKDRKYVKDKGEDARRGPPCSGAGPLPAHHVNEAADQVTSKPERQRRKPAGTPKDRAAHRFASASRDRQDISDSPFAVLRHMFDGGETQSSERGRKRK